MIEIYQMEDCIQIIIRMPKVHISFDSPQRHDMLVQGDTEPATVHNDHNNKKAVTSTLTRSLTKDDRYTPQA